VFRLCQVPSPKSGDIGQPRHLRNPRSLPHHTIHLPPSLSSQPHHSPITHPSGYTTMPTTRSNVPTTRSGLQRGNPPLAKRKRSNADEQTRKRPKSEKDDEEEIKKGKGGRDGKKKKNKRRGKGTRYVPTIAIANPADTPIDQENQRRQSKGRGGCKGSC